MIPELIPMRKDFYSDVRVRALRHENIRISLGEIDHTAVSFASILIPDRSGLESHLTLIFLSFFCFFSPSHSFLKVYHRRCSGGKMDAPKLLRVALH